jgi:rRNA maturation endonuclease Nob1
MIPAIAIVLTISAFSLIFFIRPQDIPEPVPISPIAHLEDRKQAIYDNLRDLQFEYRLGKLSDADYQQTKQSLQKELALVLAEMEAITTRLGLKQVRVPAAKIAVPRRSNKTSSGTKAAARTVCPHCGAKFPQPLKFCGECGKAMA